MSIAADQWELLCSYREQFTCYSAAVARWAGESHEDWRPLVSTGLWLRLSEAGGGLFGFGYFPPTRRAELGLARTGSDQAQAAREGVLAEIERTGRVIIAGDGYHLPWHVAHGRVHAPHWYVLAGAGEELEVADPFACRNELGVQKVARRTVAESELDELLRALPGDDAVHNLREILALGDETDEAVSLRYQWFVQREVENGTPPEGLDGPEAILRLARHFRERGSDPAAYAQADDIWSIARHRAFMCRYAQELAAETGDEEQAAWAQEHALPLAKKWGHIAPLMMQAILSLRAGREPSASLPSTLEQLAELEQSAALAYARHSFTISAEGRP